MSYCPGLGDSATWPPYSGHPHDPRAPEMEDDLDWPLDPPEEPNDDDWEDDE